MPDSATTAFARAVDYFFGILHSRTRGLVAPHGHLTYKDRPRYTPATCFETFPLPWPPSHEPTGDPRVEAIATAAKRLDDLRRAWLSPNGADPAEMKKRTLTKLYNARPTWLANAHATLDRAVWTAYAWRPDEHPATVEEDVILGRRLALNLGRGG